MATINFFIQSKNNPAGIYVRLKEGRNIDAKAKTKLVINPNDWSKTKGCPKTLKSEDLKYLNNELLKFHSDLLSHFNQSVGKKPINTQWLKDFITPPIKSTDVPNSLLEYLDYYAINKKTIISPSTYKKIGVIKHLLERFQREIKKTYLISEVDLDFKLRFETYCQKQNYAPNTIARAIKFIKTICFHARRNKIETSYQLDSIKVKYKKVQNIYLTPEELKQIENINLFKDHLITTRDWLIISCETGQRVSDFMKFQKNLIRYENNKPLIEFTQEKTKKLMTIPLSKKVMEILRKRNGEFPNTLSDQKYNTYIKDVCKCAGLTQKVNGSLNDPITNRKITGVFEKWQLVSSHIGRRSFATNNYGIIPTSLLISATGHSTEKMFLEYIGKTDTQKALQLAEFFN